MSSSVTLTVSHLPTSTSFFLSALQPLNYGYRGHSNNTIGFGSTTNPSAPPDFWITQEVPGVPAGAVHVAFQAPSRIAVQHFVTAALKAGSNIHGEPAVRDSSGYYSAAVIDSDGNSIEAVFRPSLSDDDENEVESAALSKAVTKAPSEMKRQAPGAPTSQVKSSVSHSAALTEAPTPARRHPSDVIDSVVPEAHSAGNVARNLAQAGSDFPPQYHTSAEGSSNFILGTVLGFAAGAALHYVFSNGKSSNSGPSASVRSIVQPEAPAHYQACNRPNGRSHLVLGDNDDGSTIRPTTRSAASPRRNSVGGQTVSCSGFGNANNPSHSTATNASQRPEMVEARPPSSFKSPLPPPSQLCRSSSHHTEAPSSALSDTSRPSRTPCSSDRHSSNEAQAPTLSSTTTNNTSMTRIHRALRTSTHPPPSTAASLATPLSEANLARATNNPTPTQPPPLLPVTTSAPLHPRDPKADPDPKARPLDKRSNRSSNTATRRARRSCSSAAASTAAEKRSQTSTQKTDTEIMPEDSISQVSTVRTSAARRSGVSTTSTLRPSRK